ncbi:hypothetical protein Pori4_00172 [Pseudomonas phage vB_PpuM-Pori-4]
MAKRVNHQVMIWTGTYDDLITWITPKVRARVTQLMRAGVHAKEELHTIVHIYRTTLPDVWAHSREPYSDVIRLALDLELHASVDLSEKPKPVLRLV